MLFTAIPFALLVNSSSVHMSLQVERDGSARRLISVETSPYFKGQVSKWVGDVQAGRPWDRTWRRDSGTTYSYARDYRTQALNSQSVNGHLEIEDVFQNPLSVFTTYTWQEEVTFGYLYDSDRTAAQAAQTQVVYEVVMPGQVTDATVRESKPSRTGLPPSWAPVRERRGPVLWWRRCSRARLGPRRCRLPTLPRPRSRLRQPPGQHPLRQRLPPPPGQPPPRPARSPPLLPPARHPRLPPPPRHAARRLLSLTAQHLRPRPGRAPLRP